MTRPTGDPAASWASLLERMSELGALIEREAIDDVERAEGYRHLTRLWSVTAEWFLEKADPARPAFTRVITPWRKFMGDNPDTLYDVAPVEAGGRYRLRGQRGDALYLGVTVYGRDAGGDISLLGQVADEEFVTGRDGTFDLVIGGENPGHDTSWIPLRAGAESLWVRQYFHDPESAAPADFRLVRLDVDTAAPPSLDGERVAASLDRMATFMSATMDAVTTLSGMMGRQPNRPLMAGASFAVDDPDGPPDAATDLETLLLKLGKVSHPTPDNRYAGVWFELGPDEALVVSGTPPPGARYWGVQLANRWQESLDYLHHGACLNDRQIQLEPDGTYRIVVAATDPGAANWLDTAGHRCGMVNVRALLAVELDDPNYRVVPIGAAATVVEEGETP